MSLVEHICRELEARKNLALVSVVRQLASAPRHTGARMLVGLDGLIAGTIGGGILEKQALEVGMRVAARGIAEFLDFELTGKDAASADMICGGSVRLFVEPLRADSMTRTLYQRLRLAEGAGDDMFCVVPVSAPGQRRLCRRDMTAWPLPTELSGMIRERLQTDGLGEHAELEDSRGQRFVLEPWPAPWRILFMGGGHVAQATAAIARMADFTFCVVDDREEFANAERFPDAAITRVAPEFESCFQGLTPGTKTFVLIVTRGHLYDRKVLAQALQTKAGYIGMIGSQRKIAAIYDQLKAEGVRDEDLARVTSPVGLSIGAETPEEIGVSIMAQLIAARAVQQGSTRHLDAALAGRTAR